jgi:hypothetical protein
MARILQDARVVALEVWVHTERSDGSGYTNLNPPNELGEPWSLLRGQRMTIELAIDGTLTVDRL